VNDPSFSEPELIQPPRPWVEPPRQSQSQHSQTSIHNFVPPFPEKGVEGVRGNETSPNSKNQTRRSEPGGQKLD
jgi:hypothetical protein